MNCLPLLCCAILSSERGEAPHYSKEIESMGVYLNSKKPFLLFRETASSTYFVDKSEIIKDLIPLIEDNTPCVCQTTPAQDSLVPERGKDHKYICITRPRRFGKTVIANMIASYFGKGADSGPVFKNLDISSYDWLKKHLNRHNVIHIMLNEMPDECTTYAQYISRIKRRLMNDLMHAFPETYIDPEESLWDAFNRIIEFGDEERFIFTIENNISPVDLSVNSNPEERPSPYIL